MDGKKLITLMSLASITLPSYASTEIDDIDIKESRLHKRLVTQEELSCDQDGNCGCNGGNCSCGNNRSC